MLWRCTAYEVKSYSYDRHHDDDVSSIGTSTVEKLLKTFLFIVLHLLHHYVMSALLFVSGLNRDDMIMVIKYFLVN